MPLLTVLGFSTIVSWQRMRNSGAQITTSESVLFQMLGESLLWHFFASIKSLDAADTPLLVSASVMPQLMRLIPSLRLFLVSS